VKNVAMTQTETAQLEKWWGEFDLPNEQWCLWEIGPMALYVKRSLAELHLAWLQGDDPLEQRADWLQQVDEKPNLDGYEQSRFVFEQSSHRFNLGLRLADRSIIVRPEVPLCVPAGESTTLFVSTALWVCPSMQASTLLELPLYRSSDTWFGQNTISGELCYMTKSRARTEYTDSINYSHRAITEIKIRNSSDKTVRIDRIRVPVKNLALYEDSSGRFQTDTLLLSVFSNEKDTKMEILELKQQLDDLALVASPRLPIESGIIHQTFAKLFE